MSGWDGPRTAPLTILLPLLAVGLGLPGLLFSVDGLIAAALFAICAGLVAFGVGFRVTIDARGVHLAKHWLGVPFRRQSIPHDQKPRPDAWWPLESKRPDGVVLCGAELPGQMHLLFGTPKETEEIERALRDEIAAVQAALVSAREHR